MVRILRVVLPAVVAITAVSITVTTYLGQLLIASPVKVDSMVISGSKVTMDHPHMSGYTRDGRAYELRANAAVQDITKPDLVELHKIDAKVEMQDKSTVRLVSPKGEYNSKAEKLDLEQNVLVTSSNGYEGRLKEARVDIKTGHVVSDKPVTMKMLQGTLDANRMEILDSGDLIQFENGVHLTTFLNTNAIKNKTASANDSTGNRADAAPSNASGAKAAGLVLTRLPRPDPRRALASRSAPARRPPLPLRPQARPRSSEFSQGALR